MIVVLTEEAEADIERIGDSITRDNPIRAASFAQELIDRCERSAETPLGFPLVPRYERTGIRRRPHGAYLIVYRVVAERIDVVHILNGAQDYERTLFEAD